MRKAIYKTILWLPIMILIISIMACGQRISLEPRYEYKDKEEAEEPPQGNLVQVQEADNQSSIAQVAKKLIPSVVGISTIETTREALFSEPQIVQGIGSGVIVDSNGYILTNDHVAGGDPTSITVILSNGDELEGQTLWSDPTLDLAMVKVNASNLPAASLGDSQSLSIGDAAIAIGTPLGLQFQHTVTAGIISALNRTVIVSTTLGENFMEDLIQTDASINPGNSGGPLVNMRGEVIGINTVKVSSAEGIGFAIPIDVAKPIVQHFLEEGEFVTPYIGIVGFDKEIASYYKKDPNIKDGVYVMEVDSRGPAHKAGIRVDDIITRIGKQKVTKMLELRKAIYSYKVGQQVDITILRNGQERTVTMVLEEKPV